MPSTVWAPPVKCPMRPKIKEKVNIKNYKMCEHGLRRCLWNGDFEIPAHRQPVHKQPVSLNLGLTLNLGVGLNLNLGLTLEAEFESESELGSESESESGSESGVWFCIWFNVWIWICIWIWVRLWLWIWIWIRTNTKEAPRRLPGGTQEASRRHPGGTHRRFSTLAWEQTYAYVYLAVIWLLKKLDIF